MDLASAIVRRLPGGRGFEQAGSELAAQLRRCADSVPEDCDLILGGSLARGEPLVRVNASGYELISDIDLLLVHHTLLPPFTTDAFVRQHRWTLPTITVMSVSAAEYQRLGTSLGHDFKDGGIILTDRAVEFEPVDLDDRDAFEVFVFGVLLTFLDEVLADPYPQTSRVLGKIIRSVGLLNGVSAQHDVGQCDGALAASQRRQLAYLHDSSKRTPQPRCADVFPTLTAGLALHDAASGRCRRDAVEGTRYEGRPGSGTVAEVQRVLIETLRRMVAARPDGEDTEDVARACAEAWRSVVRDKIARAYASPADYCRSVVPMFRHALLDMKVRTNDRRLG